MKLTGVRSAFVIDSSRISRSSAFAQYSTRSVSRLSLTTIRRSKSDWYPVDEHSRHPLPYPLRRLKRTASLDFPQDGQHERCVDLLQRYRADVRENLLLQALQDVAGVDGDPPRGLHLMPFARYCLEGRLRGCHRDEPPLLRFHGRVPMLAEDSLRLIPPLPCFSEGEIGVGTENKELLLPCETIFEPPGFEPFLGDEEMQSAAVGKLVIALLSLRLPDLEIGEHRYPQIPISTPPKYPHSTLEMGKCGWSAVDAN
jgi:hypothetical protein